MKTLQTLAHYVLVALTAFLALTAFAGGIGLLTGLNAPPVSYLRTSLFRDFTVPGLALSVLVGGSALLAIVLLLRRNRLALPCAAASGVAIVFFEFVEVLVIGSPAGVARTLQIFYFGLGTLILVVAISQWILELRAAPR
jgi:hypothetical protein